MDGNEDDAEAVYGRVQSRDDQRPLQACPELRRGGGRGNPPRRPWRSFEAVKYA